MSFAATSSRGARLKARFAVNGIQCSSSESCSAALAAMAAISAEFAVSVIISRHPVGARLAVPFCRCLPAARPELDRPLAGDLTDAEAGVSPPAEAERLAGDR